MLFRQMYIKPYLYHIDVLWDLFQKKNPVVIHLGPPKYPVHWYIGGLNKY